MVETSNNTSMSKARREPQRGPGNHRGALSQPHSVCVEIETEGENVGTGVPSPSDNMGLGERCKRIDFKYISCQKEAIWNTLFSILSDGGAPQTSRGPGKLPPPFSTGLGSP